jgi:hypothetical protein
MGRFSIYNAVGKYKSMHSNVRNAYFFIDIPSEDLFLTQAFTYNGYRLVESRLNYYLEKPMQSYIHLFSS